MRTFTLLIFFIFLFSASCNTDNSSGISRTAKNFDLPSFMDDNNYQLNQFKGKPVIINFWASWCAPCRQEMPFLETVWKAQKGNDLVLLGINVLDDKGEAEDTLKEFGITYLNLYDPEGDIKEKYNLLALPVTYFIDKEGNISKINYGPFLGKDGEKLFNQLLKEIL